jgi:hypothetical protein
MRLLIVVTVVLLVIRLWAARHVGFGDSEALYACWAAHPQPAYLDHPGLVGLIARVIGGGAIPTAQRTHTVTAIVATLVPWLIAAVARAAGARSRHAYGAALVVAVIPEIAVGLFALTPDLLLAPLWVGSMGLAIVGLAHRPAAPPAAATGAKRSAKRGKRGKRRKQPNEDDDDAAARTPRAELCAELRPAAALLGAGLLAGIAASAKVSGLLLMAALFAIYVERALRRDGEGSCFAGSIWPWAGLAAGAIVLIPTLLYEARLGFPMSRHRLVDTQHGAGLALSNLGALVAGQLAYLSPVVAWIAFVVGRDLVRRRNDDVASSVLFWTFALPLVPLVVLCVWSPVAEPHWIAPALLALPIHAARRAGDAAASFLRPRLLHVAGGLAAAFTAAAHAWVLVPASARLIPSSVDPRLDIASELYGWPQAVDAVREQMSLAATPFDPEGREVVVVGPHWTVCAQLHAALEGVRVGCATPIPDDFDRWVSRDTWRRAENVLFVTDNRFPGDGSDQLPEHVRVSQSRVRVLRGGRTSRVFDLYMYSRRQRAELQLR